ncbi:MAG TPA: Tat pathway signal protein [Candidatus Galloscillospira excrementavium]|nr:Tat pathway signal protein [Candidatus Galloscillospira excrementavium]
MPILLIICLIPLLLGLIAEYLVCRRTKKRLLRLLPPLVSLLLTAGVAAWRWAVWPAEHGGGSPPIETMILIPGLPACALFLGLLLGWRLWRRLWRPRIIRED